MWKYYWNIGKRKKRKCKANNKTNKGKDGDCQGCAGEEGVKLVNCSLHTPIFLCAQKGIFVFCFWPYLVSLFIASGFFYPPMWLSGCWYSAGEGLPSALKEFVLGRGSKHGTEIRTELSLHVQYPRSTKSLTRKKWCSCQVVHCTSELLDSGSEPHDRLMTSEVIHQVTFGSIFQEIGLLTEIGDIASPYVLHCLS